MTSNVFRGFICIPISSDVKIFLKRFTSEVKSLFPQWRFSSIGNLHITIQFLGNHVQRSMVPEFLSIIEDAVVGVQPFELCLGYASAFPNKGLPRILYVGTSIGSDEIIKLASSVRANLSALGFHENQPFKSHITLARRRKGKARGYSDTTKSDALYERTMWKTKFSSFKDKYFAQSKRAKICWHISEVLLMQSILHRQGPEYRVLGNVMLVDK